MSESWIYKVAHEKRIPKTLMQGRTLYSKKHVERHFKHYNPNDIAEDEWYSVMDLQEQYGLTSAATYSFVSENAIPKRKEGRTVFYSKFHFDVAKGYKEMMAKSEVICSMRTRSIINDEYGFIDKTKKRSDFFTYFEAKAKKNGQKWMIVHNHFSNFVNWECTFGDVDVQLCNKFRNYLLNAKTDAQ